MTGPTWMTDYGDAIGQSSIDIVSTGRTLAAGLGGRVVVSAPEKYVWGIPSAQALVVATLAGQAGKAAFYAYEQGSSMKGDAGNRRLLDPIGLLMLFNIVMVGLVPTTHDLGAEGRRAAPPRPLLHPPVFMGRRDKPDDDDKEGRGLSHQARGNSCFEISRPRPPRAEPGPRIATAAGRCGRRPAVRGRARSSPRPVHRRRRR